MVSMKMNQKKGCCYLYNLMLYSLTGLACSSFICYCCYKFPMKEFLFLYVPYIWSWICSPKCLFIIANLIIVFLVGESNFMRNSSSSSSAASELYDEYVERSSRRVRAENFPEKIEEKKAHHHHDQLKVIEQSVKRVHHQFNIKDVIKEKENKIDEEEEEAGFPAEELKKRVEEFIARVNKQRWLESRSLVCIKA